MSPFSTGAALRFGARNLLPNLPVFLAIEVGIVVVWALTEVLVFNFASAPGSLWWTVFHLFWFVAMSVPEVALLRVALSIRESGSWEREDLVAAVRTAPTFFVAKVIYLVMVVVGLLLLIVPGVRLAVRYFPWGFLVAAGERRPPELLRASARLTRGAKWKLFRFGLLLVLINVLGAALLGVGFVFTLPLTVMAGADVFVRLRNGDFRFSGVR